jgi:hypothetical protein
MAENSFPLPSTGNISDNGKDFSAASLPEISGPMNPAPKVQTGVQQKPLESPPVSNVSDSGTKIS